MQSTRQTSGARPSMGWARPNRIALVRCRAPHQQLALSMEVPPASQLGSVCCDVERSAMVHEELQLFIRQLSLDSQEKRALSYKAYAQAKRVKKRRQKVDVALEDLRARKATVSLQLGVQLGTTDASREGWAAAPKPATKPTTTATTAAPKPGITVGMADLTMQGVQLRIAIARALEREDYIAAAGLRDALKRLEEQIASSTAVAQLLHVDEGITRYPRLSLGQRVWHMHYGYRAVVVGWDSCCCESTAWRESCRQAAARHPSLNAGSFPQPQQYHYHVLVDVRDWQPKQENASNKKQYPVAYVAEELLWAPEHGGVIPKVVLDRACLSSSSGMMTRGANWAQVFGDDGLQHPLLDDLFLGLDKRGNYVPIRQW